MIEDAINGRGCGHTRCLAPMSKPGREIPPDVYYRPPPPTNPQEYK